MSEHTPGPWIAVGAWVEVEDDNIPDICTCEPSDIGQGHLARTDKEIMANARLIAAAPDLLEVLDSCAGVLTVFVDDGSAALDSVIGKNLTAARAAIAKAIGVTNAN